MKDELDYIETITTTCGQRITALREQRGWTKKYLGYLAGVHAEYLNRVEKGTHALSLPLLYRIAVAFNVELQELLPTVGDVTKPINNYIELTHAGLPSCACGADVYVKDLCYQCYRHRCDKHKQIRKDKSNKVKNYPPAGTECIREGCTLSSIARGYCSTHYSAWIRSERKRIDQQNMELIKNGKWDEYESLDKELVSTQGR